MRILKLGSYPLEISRNSTNNRLKKAQLLLELSNNSVRPTMPESQLSPRLSARFRYPPLISLLELRQGPKLPSKQLLMGSTAQMQLNNSRPVINFSSNL